MAAKKRRKIIRKKPIATECLYCKESKEPSYKDYEEISKFVTDRAKILGRTISGLCSKHQRRLTKAVKRARYLGLLPFKSEV